MKVMVVFGTRPEVIKLAPVILELKRRSTQLVDVITCHSGQHREMATQALNVFGITPDIELGVMKADQSLPDLTARLMTAITDALLRHRPQVVIVQGDTTTAFVGGLASFYAGIPVAHVEAGLRTGNMQSPFPEELNRVMLSKIARWHFAPTNKAASALLREHIAQDRIWITGNTVVDAIEIVRKKWDLDSIRRRLGVNVTPGQCVLITTHRRENFGEGLRNILEAIVYLADKYQELKFVFPVHLNPNIQATVRQYLTGLHNVILMEPVDFETSLYLQSVSCLILTDSGGIQEEAPSFSVPTIVMREHTERGEGVAAGFAYLVGKSKADIIKFSEEWLEDPSKRLKLKSLGNPYGNGNAAEEIADVLLASDSII